VEEHKGVLCQEKGKRAFYPGREGGIRKRDNGPFGLKRHCPIKNDWPKGKGVRRRKDEKNHRRTFRRGTSEGGAVGVLDGTWNVTRKQEIRDGERGPCNSAVRKEFRKAPGQRGKTA